MLLIGIKATLAALPGSKNSNEEKLKPITLISYKCNYKISKLYNQHWVS